MTLVINGRPGNNKGVIPMVVVLRLPHPEFISNDHREYAPHLRFLMTLVKIKNLVIQNESTLVQSGVKDGDIIMALPVNAQQLLQQQQQQQQQSRSRSRGPPNFQQQVQQLMADPSQRAIFRERWPSLAQALDSGDTNKAAKLLEDHWKTKQEEDERLRRAEANPEDPENQKYLEERIRQQNVDQSLMEAQENFPEMFGTVVMLYIECKGMDLKCASKSILTKPSIDSWLL